MTDGQTELLPRVLITASHLSVSVLQKFLVWLFDRGHDTFVLSGGCLYRHGMEWSQCARGTLLAKYNVMALLIAPCVLRRYAVRATTQCHAEQAKITSQNRRLALGINVGSD